MTLGCSSFYLLQSGFIFKGTILSQETSTYSDNIGNLVPDSRVYSDSSSDPWHYFSFSNIDSACDLDSALGFPLESGNLGSDSRHDLAPTLLQWLNYKARMLVPWFFHTISTTVWRLHHTLPVLAKLLLVLSRLSLVPEVFNGSATCSGFGLQKLVAITSLAYHVTEDRLS